MSESFKDKIVRVRGQARALARPSYFCIRMTVSGLACKYGQMSLAAGMKLDDACYYETFDADRSRTDVRCNDLDALHDLPADALAELDLPYAPRAPLPKAPAIEKGERERLWWEIERDEKRAAFERMVALRNEVRRICGQGGD